MEVVKKVNKLCLCCMEEHEVQIVKIREKTTFKDRAIEYDAFYEYCDHTDDFLSTEEMLVANDIAVKDAYRVNVGLLTAKQIYEIRKKYGISQSDLAILLNWGAKTITRYESHQVQDAAHDTILRKLDSDPEWFLQLLCEAKDRLSPAAFEKYHDTVVQLYEADQDNYLRKSIEARFAKFNSNISCCGGSPLNIPKIIETISYYANSRKVYNLYKVKMMKLLWYADALSFKRHQHSITGLAYRAYPMGAVPIAHESILDLNGVCVEEIDFDNGTAYRFTQSPNREYLNLTAEDKAVLDTVIDICGNDTKDQIVQRMHAERAYVETALGDIIQYQYAKDLSMT